MSRSSRNDTPLCCGSFNMLLSLAFVMRNLIDLVREPETNVARSMLHLRIKLADNILIDRAASAAGKKRTEFVLKVARWAIEKTLADLRRFPLVSVFGSPASEKQHTPGGG